MKKVLFFCAWFPNKNNTLAGNFAVEHAKCLNNITELAIFHVNDDYDLKLWFKFEFSELQGIKIYKASFKRFSSYYLFPINVLSYFLASIIGYYHVKNKFGVADINHVHVLTKTAILPYFLKLIYKTPYVISEHWSRYLPQRNSYHGFLRNLITKEIVAKSNGLCTVSNDLMLAMNNHELKHHNSMIISNVVDDIWFKDFIKKDNKFYQFLHVSGMQDAIKNVSGILRASAMLKESGFNFLLNIVGDDIEREGIEKYANDLGLSQIVVFHGKLVGKELYKMYQSADTFVLFSNFENQPCVLLESFATGLPVIATNVGGIPEIVDSNNGVLIYPKDEDALFNEMKKFILKQYNFNTNSIKNGAFKKHSNLAVSEDLINFYNNALKI
jgi:glycosyltransferase involved in cell wall biosynthesis